MLTPYDWQEGIGHRAQYVESRLKAGVPVVAASVADGIVVATFRAQASKIFEIYDRLVYSAIGLQSDVEAIRVAAVEFAHQEGYRRSEDDVTIQRMVTHLSSPLKSAFASFNGAPVVVRSLFAEVGETVEDDRFYVLDYDGDYRICRSMGAVAGTDAAYEAIEKAVAGVDFATAVTTDAVAQLREAVLKGMDPGGELAAGSELPELSFEAVLMRRDKSRERRFSVLAGDDLPTC